MAHISVVTPVYKAEDCILELYRRLTSSLSAITEDYEIIMVEDCGGDRSWNIIKEISARDKKVKGVKFSRNFGQHYAITAGLEYANGDWVVIMDCDLQDQPEEIIKLYSKAKEGCDVVLARRAVRQDGFLKKLSARLFYTLFDYMTDTNTDQSIGTFRILSKKTVNNFLSLKEKLRFFGGMIQWIGFKTEHVDVEHAERFSGYSSYNFRKLFKLALGSMIAFSDKPLRLLTYLGFFMSLISMMYAMFIIYRKIVYQISIEGWTSLIVSLYFLGGLVLVNLGVLGLYIGRIFEEVKRRPLFIIDETTGFEKK